MRALLRCDATASGGVGHLVRCLALAEAARDAGWQVTIAGSVDVPLGRRLVERAGIQVVDAGESAEDLVEVAAAHDADVLHADHYSLPPDLRPAAGRRGILFSSIEDDDFGRRPADLVVDPTLGAELHPRPQDGSTRVLLGARYAPVRSGVRRARDRAAQRRLAEPTRRDVALEVLVVMGGTDALGAAPAIVRLATAAWAAAPIEVRLTVVAPEAGHPRLLAAADGRELTVLGPQEDLPGLAAEHDLVVSAAGTTVIELACVGVPIAIVAVTENQHTGYVRACEAGMAMGLGSLAEVRAMAPAPLEALARLVAEPAVRDELSRRGRSVVDGQGAERIVAAWSELLGTPAAPPAAADQVTARRATVEDADLLLRWRNDETTRAASRQTAAVEPSGHLRWLTATLGDDDRLLLVVELAGTPIGTSRFDRVAPDCWEISLTLAPDQRGRGLSARLLAAAEEALGHRVDRPTTVLAHVRPTNEPSLRVFRAGGYVDDPGRRTTETFAFLKAVAPSGRTTTD